jgi:cobyrinic acid a,c-diamide synthase
MYLSQLIVWGERSAEMVGALPCQIEMTGKPQGHGYVVAEVEGKTPFFPAGTVLRGHEFHNSRLVEVEVRRTMFDGTGPDESQSRLNGLIPTGRCDAPSHAASVYRLSRGNGIGHGRDGIVYRNVLAAYTHLHVGGAPDWAASLVRRAQLYQESRQPVKPS